MRPAILPKGLEEERGNLEIEWRGFREMGSDDYRGGGWDPEVRSRTPRGG